MMHLIDRSPAVLTSLAALLLFCLLGLTGGCASSRIAGPDVTGGVTLELFVDRGDRSYALYLMETDGMLHFAGGLDAYDREFTWAGPLTDEEVQQVLAFLDEHDLWHTDPVSTNEPPENKYSVKLRKPGARRSFVIVGDGPDISPLYDLIETASRRKHEEFMQMMPEPGEQPH